MSNRTLMEFNHDFAVKIAENPHGFARVLYRYLNSTDTIVLPELEAYGVTVGPTRHHSEDDPLEGKKRRARDE